MNLMIIIIILVITVISYNTNNNNYYNDNDSDIPRTLDFWKLLKMKVGFQNYEAKVLYKFLVLFKKKILLSEVISIERLKC